jgi:ketosteroid isomerase-like protein
VRPALVLIVLAGCATGAAVGPTPERARTFEPSDRQAIQAVLDAQGAAWNRGDLTAYMDGYAHTDALVFTSGGKIRRGWQAAFDHYQARYAKDPAAMGKLVFETLSIDAVGADGAVALGNWILTASPHDGRGVFSLALERRPEGWRVVHDHTSLAAE